MHLIVSLLIFFQVILSFKNPFWAFCYLLSVKILVPDNVRAPIGDMSLNTICSVILFVGWMTVIYIQTKKLSISGDSLSKYLIFFVIYLAIIVIFTPYVPIEYQFKPYVQFIVLQLLPILVMINVVKTKEDVQNLIWIFVICSLICIIYSLVCFVLFIPYPYNSWINSYYPGRDNVELSQGVEMGGIIGRCMGTATSGTYDYGMVISILTITLGVLYYKLKNKWILLVWILANLDTLCTTRRSPIITAGCFILIVFLFNSKNIAKKLGYLFLMICIVVLSVYIFPQLENFKNVLEASLFFWSDSVSEKNGISGSSVGFRTFQFYQTIKYISENPVFGNGWGSMYYQNAHPEMIGWESIVFTTLMQFGYLGAFMWSILFVQFYRYSLKSRNELLSRAFLLSSLALCFLTDTLYLFYIFFGMVLINKLRLMYPGKERYICFNKEYHKKYILIPKDKI